MSKTRRLAAIMFTDIAGYTKLMQESETRANELRERHREVFEQSHAQHNGKIIQYFGDGTLSSFDSCVDAVKCAIDMQKAFQASPQVPLRIGVHLGDIVFSGKDVYGDGVNVASRVESLSVPGAILVSDVVNQQIHNQEIDTTSMGTFRMKNVKKPIEVFAIEEDGIVLPRKKDVQGKAKRLSPLLQPKQLVTLASVGFIAMVLGAVLFWGLGASDTQNSQLLPESIREEKVAVSVFENFTGDENLDALGYLGSEWISSGLRELKVRTVSPEMVRQNKDKIGILPNNPENKPSFAEITGAKYVVTGSYFAQGDSIVLNTRLSSTETGEEVQTFPKLMGHKDQKGQLIENARQYLLGYWILRIEQKLPKINPPKYEAYQQYLKCRPGRGKCYERAVELDGEFLLARIFLYHYDGLAENYERQNETGKYILENWDKCTSYEKNTFNFAKYNRQLNYEAAFRALDMNFQVDSNDMIMLHQSAYFAAVALNKPAITARRFEYLFSRKELIGDQLWGNNFWLYMDALNRLKEAQKVIDFINALSDDLKSKIGGLQFNELILAYLQEGKTEELLTLLETPPVWVNQRKESYLIAGYVYSYLYPDANSNPFREKIISVLDSFQDPPDRNLSHQAFYAYWNFNSKATAYYVLGKWEKAEEILLSQRKVDWQAFNEKHNRPTYLRGYEALLHESMLGCVYAQKGEFQKALDQIQWLDNWEKAHPERQKGQFTRASVAYLKARIFAVMGEKEKAMDQLNLAVEKGRIFFEWNFTLDLCLVNLKGYPPFEELIRPKG